MRNGRKLLVSLLLLLVLVGTALSASAEERYLDALGRIQVRFDSFDELKPLACVSVSSIREWPGAGDVIVASTEPFAENFIKFRELEDKVLEDGDLRLSSLLAEVSLSGNFQFRLLLGNEAVYPVFFFPLSSAHDIPDQTFAVKKLVVLFSGGREVGFQQISWGARGHWGYVTMPCVGEVLGKLSAGEMEQLLASAAPTEPGEVASMTLDFEAVPKGTLQVIDVAVASACELFPYLVVDYDDVMSDYSYKPDEEYLMAMGFMSLYSTAVKDLRTVAEGLQRFTGRVIIEPESGDLVFAATTDFMPGTALARQNQTRYEHRQTLAGFYQPDDAIFAFAEGISPRLEQQSFLVAGTRAYFAATMSDFDIDFDAEVKKLESQIDNLKNPSDDDGNDDDGDEDESFSRTTMTLNIGGADQEIVLEEMPDEEKTLEELEEKLATIKAFFPVVERFVEHTLFPSLESDWQEIAVTVDHDATVLGAFRLCNGQNLADIMDLYYAEFIKQEIADTAEPLIWTMETCGETYKGFRFFSIYRPIPTERHELRIKNSRNSLEYEEDVYFEKIVTLAIYSIHENASDSLKARITQHNTNIREAIEAFKEEHPDAEHEIVTQPVESGGQNFLYRLAVSENVAAFLVGNFTDDPMPQLKAAIDRNESEQPFPETVMVFSIPTLEQLQRLMALNPGSVAIEITDEDVENADIDWPQGSIRIRANLTESSRTDRLQISRELLTFIGKAYLDTNGFTFLLPGDTEDAVRFEINPGEEPEDECEASPLEYLPLGEGYPPVTKEVDEDGN